MPLSDAVFLMCAPVEVLPVNEIQSIFCSRRSFHADDHSPTIWVKTQWGILAAWKISWSSLPTRGHSWECLKRTVFPAKSKGMTCRTKSMLGKFRGEIATATPSGSKKSLCSSFSSSYVVRGERMDSALSKYQPKYSLSVARSNLLCKIGFPTSLVMRVASSSSWAMYISNTLLRTRTLPATPRCFRSGKAVRASRAARMMSLSVDTWTSPSGKNAAAGLVDISTDMNRGDE